MSHDYRAAYAFAELFKNTVKNVAANEIKQEEDDKKRFSCRDGVFATVVRSDPFLLQQILGKMTACQLAVPLLLPNPLTEEITMLLWGLRQIKKSWIEDSGKVHEVQITENNFSVVAFLRLGNVPISKSTTLNLILGTLQGKEDHPIFLSSERDVKEPVYSKGVLEAFWFQPDKGRKTGHSPSSATCFLNLRGDATNFARQRTFACKFATCVVVFVNSSNINKYEETIDTICNATYVILVVLSQNQYKRRVMKRSQKVTVCNIGTGNNMLIAEELCYELSNYLSKGYVKQSSLAKEGVELSTSIGIAVDMSSEACRDAKDTAMTIVHDAQKSPESYKASVLKLQQIWRQWTTVDRKTSWNAHDGNIATHLNIMEMKKRALRKSQFETGASSSIKLFYECLLMADDEEVQFLTTWLHILLDEIFQTLQKTLITQIKMLESALKNNKKQITTMRNAIEERDTISDKDERAIMENMYELDRQFCKQRIDVTKQIDDTSIGFEHLLREVGQLYESHCELKIKHDAKGANPDVHILPDAAARLLLLGQPIEISDGDTCHIPVLWVKGVLNAVQSQIKFDAKLFIISVLGVQSSGMSTLLNSMFGVRFDVGAGPCMRGVYMQMLEVEDKLRKKLGYDFLVLVDTGGLRDPEKIIVGRPDLDNKLVTFALCISNMTLINIGGQTAGDDLIDVLQVAAHAFIRMKEVQLQPSCTLVLQFVEDLTAPSRNENNTQSIKQKLDEAIKTAAKEEGMHRRYRQFTDVFNILNDDYLRDLQYIPSLGRSLTTPPNYNYSEKVIKLKALLLDSKTNDDTTFLNISEFGKRTENVWNAVKQENFVFIFRNTKIMAQCKKFQDICQTFKTNIRKDTMFLKLEMEDRIKNATADNIDRVVSQAKEGLSCAIRSMYEAAKAEITEVLEDITFCEVKKFYKQYFLCDLQCYEQRIWIQWENRLDITAQNLRQKITTENEHLPNFLAELRMCVSSVARDLQNLHLDQFKKGKGIAEKEIRQQFDNEWQTFMEEMHKNFPSYSEDDIHEQVNMLVTRCITQNANCTNFSKFLRSELLHKENYHSFAANLGIIHFKEDAQKFVQIFENENTARINSVYERIEETAQGKPLHKESCNYNDIISDEILQSLQTGFERLLDEIHVSGFNDIQWLFACVASVTISKLQQNWEEYFGQFNSEFSIDIGLESSESIFVNIKSKLDEKLSSRNIFMSAWHTTEGLLERGASHRQSQDNVQTEIQNLIEQLKYDKRSYESGKLISDFLDSVIQIVYLNVRMQNRKEVLLDACSRLARLIHRKIESSKLDSTGIAKKYPSYTEGIFKIKIMILNMIKLVLDEEKVKQMEEDLTPEMIAKLANLPHSINLQRAADMKILSTLEKRQSDNYTQIFTISRDIKRNFLRDLLQNGYIDEFLISDLINNTQRQFQKHLETDEVAYMILHMCAWAFPLCAAFQVSYEKENNIVLQLEKTKEIYFEDFKNLCLDYANDKRQAEELHALLKPAILASVKNKICTTLFRLLASEDKIFISRQHLIRHMLQQLAEEEDFKSYLLYIKDHQLFTKTWIKKHIASICSKRTTKLNIQNLASSEIESMVDFTRLCFLESLSHVNDVGEVLSPVNVLDIFLDKCKEISSIYVTVNDFDTFKKFSSSIKEYQTYREEFLKLLQDLPGQLMVDLNVPKQNDVDGTARWLQRLPVSLDMELAKCVEGCKNQCPFCGSVCDETIPTHNKHFAVLHYPRGIKGVRDKRTKELVCDVCTALVATDSRFYPNCTCDGKDCDCRWVYFKEYEKEYPDWYIRPIPDNELTVYWKWVMAKFNKEFSNSYNAKMARIPHTWRKITKREALDSLHDIYL